MDRQARDPASRQSDHASDGCVREGQDAGAGIFGEVQGIYGLGSVGAFIQTEGFFCICEGCPFIPSDERLKPDREAA